VFPYPQERPQEKEDIIRWCKDIALGRDPEFLKTTGFQTEVKDKSITMTFLQNVSITTRNDFSN